MNTVASCVTATVAPDFIHILKRYYTDPGRPYAYRTAADLLQDFFREVSRVMLENGFDLDHGRESQTDEETFG